MAKKIPLVEIFGPTIQGEGSVVGCQTIFLRFGGCDYLCEKCDSLHAVLPKEFAKTAQKLTPDELVETTEEFIKQNCPHIEWITLSGGNPCMWDLYQLVTKLGGPESYRFKFALETQGTLWQPWIPYCAAVTVSPKGPGMGEKFEPEKFQVFYDHLVDHPGFSIKVVVFDQRDLEFAKELMRRFPRIRNRMFFSIGNVNPPAPAKRLLPHPQTHAQFVLSTLDNMKLLLEDIMADPDLAGVRTLPQLHTLLWGNEQGK